MELTTTTPTTVVAETPIVVTPSETSTTPTTSIPTGPRDTATVARETMAALDKADTEAEAQANDDNETETAKAAPVTEKPAVETKSDTVAPVVEEELSEADKLLKEAGYDVKAGSKDNRIPYSKVKTIITNQLAKERQTFETERGETKAKIAEFETTMEEVGRVESMMMSQDPKAVKAFLDGLADVNPVLKTVLAGVAPVATTQSTTAPLAASEMPKPNAKLSDGTMTYDLDGIKSLLDWNTTQVEQRLAPKFKTIEDLEAARRKEIEGVENERRRQTVLSEREKVVETQLQEARQWPGFADNYDAILDALKKDSEEARKTKSRPKHTLESAYRAVVVPKLMTTRDSLRAEILKEINQQPRSTSTAPTPSVAAPIKAGTRSTEDIARETIRRLEGGGA